ncbi:MAG: hypothetical protein K6D38_03050 [Pseudobutyrivibrio sp.]|nr:hypothetical protein [Pseudobutyrivibrio sp.]
MKKDLKKPLIMIFILSALLTVVTVLVFGKTMFIHRGSTIISDWSQCDSEGYDFLEDRMISNTPDPHIFFYSDGTVDKVEVDLSMYSTEESMVNSVVEGEEIIYAELFWADEKGEMNESDSIPFKIKGGRNSYLFDVKCPANTLFRLDIGDGVGVEFSPMSFTFYTVKEYTMAEKVKSSFIMFGCVFVTLLIYYGFVSKSKR